MHYNHHYQIIFNLNSKLETKPLHTSMIIVNQLELRAAAATTY